MLSRNLPVTNVRAAKQAKAERSISVEWSDRENSWMAFIHWPKLGLHCVADSTTPLSKTNLLSSGRFLCFQTSKLSVNYKWFDVCCCWLPVCQTDDYEFQAGWLEQEILILCTEVAEAGNLFCPSFDDVDARSQQREELACLIRFYFAWIWREGAAFRHLWLFVLDRANYRIDVTGMNEIVSSCDLPKCSSNWTNRAKIRRELEPKPIRATQVVNEA